MRIKRSFSWIFLIAMALLLTVAHHNASADPVLQPDGLSPGDTYQLVFLSSQRIAGTMDLDSYNYLYQGYADCADIGEGSTLFGFDLNWHVVASGEDGDWPGVWIDARDNAPAVADVYDLQGNLISSAADFYSQNHVTEIMYDEYGEVQEHFVWTMYQTYQFVWTGTYNDGTASDLPLGDLDESVTVGMTFAYHMDTDEYHPGLGWLDWVQMLGSREFAFYVLSDPITVPGAVPEPATLLLLSSGCAGMACIMRRRKSQN